MKIYICEPYLDWECDQMTPFVCCITIEDDYDVEVLSKMIKEGDFIRIHRYFWLIVSNVNFIATPRKMIELLGRKYGMDEERVLIEKNMTIEIEVESEEGNADKIRKLEKMKREHEKYEMYKKSISSEHIQNEGFRILQQYIDRKPYQIVYGNDVITSMKEGLIKVVFACWKFIKVQDQRMIKILTHESHKYEKTNIVVIWKGNEHYEELKSYGGIVGVLY